MPCYNVAPYVGRCIESIETQDIPQAEYEIICVDDCSKDDTAQTIEEYMNQYSNIVLHRHTVNKTAGGARNTGIELAKGKYIWFVDPDDAVKPNVLEKLYAAAEAAKADTLMFNFQTVLEDRQISAQKIFEDFLEPLSGSEFLEVHNISMHHVVSVYAAIYSREFLIENDLRFPEIKASQDVVFIWDSLLASKRYASIADICYSYIRRSNSMTGNRGKFTANAILSQSLLFGTEINRILSSNSTIPTRIRKEICDALDSTINRDSRNIIYSEPQEQRAFYDALRPRKDDIDALRPVMNRKTQTLFNYSYPYAIWKLWLSLYKLTNKLHNRPENY